MEPDNRWRSTIQWTIEESKLLARRTELINDQRNILLSIHQDRKMSEEEVSQYPELLDSMELASFKEEGLSRNLYFLEKRVLSELNEAWKQLKQDEEIHTSWWVHDNPSYGNDGSHGETSFDGQGQGEWQGQLEIPVAVDDKIQNLFTNLDSVVDVLKATENFKLETDKFPFESAKDFVDFNKNSTLSLEEIEVLFEGLGMLSEQMLESIKATRTP